MVKYSGRRIEIATIKGPVQVPLSIGGIAIKPQLLQSAGQILKILDWLQFTGCKKIHALKKLKDIPQGTIADLILRQYEDARMIAYVTLISIAACNSPKNFENVLADWIAEALPRVKQWPARRPISAGEKEKMEKLRNDFKRLENRTKLVEEEIKSLTAQLQEMKLIKRKLEKEKNELQLLSKQAFMDAYALEALKKIPMRAELEEISIRAELEDKLSEAISAFPYLSQAISKKKPFDIEKSVKALMGN